MTNPIKPSPTKLTQAFVLMGVMGVLTTTAHAETWIATPDGCKAHNPFPQPKETVSWTGDCVDGYVHGQGTFAWYREGELKELYIGGYYKGKMHGDGAFWWDDGTRFEGEFANDRMHGFGKYMLKNEEDIVSWQMDNIGFWQGKVYVVQGIFMHDGLEVECHSKELCKAMYGVETVGFKNR